MSPLEKAAIAYTGKWRDGVHIDNGFGTAQRMWESMGAAQKESHLAALRAAIEALMEPTGEMKDAGAESYGVPPSITGQPTKAWQAMLRKVLEP
jgi:hypothetical protein